MPGNPSVAREETADSSGGFRRVLGPLDAISVVVGAIIGVGIFFVPTQIAKSAGSETLALACWALGGFVALCGAFTFAALGRIDPKTGGQYHILRDAWGSFPAFLYVCCNLSAIQAGAVSVISIVAAQNLAEMTSDGEPSDLTIQILAHSMIWGLALANIIGVRLGARVQNMTVVAKLLVLVVIIGAAVVLPAASRPVATPAVSNGTENILLILFAGIIPTMFAYGGWQQALWMGGEIKDAQRSLPRAILVGVLIVVLVYLGLSWAYFQLLGYDGVTSAKALPSEAATVIFGDLGGKIIAGAVFISAFGVMNAQFLTGPRLTFAMAEDGYFFRFFAKIGTKSGTPWAAIIFLASLSSGLLVAFGNDAVDKMTAWVVVIDALFFALTAGALFRLRRSRVAGITRLELGAAFLFGVLELAGVFGALQLESTRNAAWFGLAWICATALLYGVFWRRR